MVAEDAMVATAVALDARVTFVSAVATSSRLTRILPVLPAIAEVVFIETIVESPGRSVIAWVQPTAIQVKTRMRIAWSTFLTR